MHIGHYGFVESLNPLLLLLEEAQVADNPQGLLQLLDEPDELMKFVMPDEFFDLGYPCLEMFDFL